MFDFKNINGKKWMPKGDILDYPDELYDWIDNFQRDFSKIYDYKPLKAYVNQAKKWLKDEDTINDYQDSASQHDFIKREIMRVRTNSLYYLDKYHYIMEGDAMGGFMKFKSYENQHVVSFLFDCGYSFMAAKARQIFFSTTMGGLVLNRINSRLNYQAAYIADLKKKAQKLFYQKIEWPHRQLPDYLRANVYSSRDEKLVFAEKRKSAEQGNNSMIEVLAADDTAATGIVANLTVLDEIGLNANFSGLLSELRPALFWYNPETNKLQLKRQLIAFGTGGNVLKGGAGMEMEWNAAIKAWEEKDPGHGLIPIFFNVFTRKGVNKEWYDQEKDKAYSKTGPDRDDVITKFHQHNPVTIQDVFMRGSRTLVSGPQIQAHLLRIYNMNLQPTKGYFEPETVQNGKIMRVKFVPTGDGEYAPITIFKFPERNWEFRYYKGTDPVNSSTGASKFASAIWDSHANEISALMNHKEKDFTYLYEQSLMLNIFYGGIKELIEINVGDAYAEYIRTSGWGHVIMGNKMLPLYLQSGTQIGVWNSGKTARFIINELLKLLQAYADNIHVEVFWRQMLRFIEKVKANGEVKWEAEDKRFYQDDAIFAITFSYLAADAYARYTPKETGKIDESKITTKNYVDGNYNLRRGVFSKTSGRKIR